jgi:hypothetical protein
VLLSIHHKLTVQNQFLSACNVEIEYLVGTLTRAIGMLSTRSPNPICRLTRGDYLASDSLAFSGLTW